MIRIFTGADGKRAFEVSNTQGVIFSGGGFESDGVVEAHLSAVFAGVRNGFDNIKIE
jgi:hypothetical protein